jgi:hypothetical protein
MATTIAPIEALEYAESVVKKMPLEEVWLNIANDIHRRIWQEANWHWTISSTSPLTIAASTTGGSQTVTFTALTDVARFIEAIGITEMASGGGRTDTTEHLLPVSINPTTTWVGRPNTFQYIPGNPDDTFKFNVKPAYPVTCTLTGVYKKEFPTIVPSTLYIASANNPQLPDDWYHVYQDGVLWQAMMYAGDNRQGSMQMAPNGGIQYTGQYGVFMSALAKMAAKEPTYLLERRQVNEGNS